MAFPGCGAGRLFRGDRSEPGKCHAGVEHLLDPRLGLDEVGPRVVVELDGPLRQERPDPAVEAAKRFKQTDTKVLDFTPFFCGKSFCYPVVGGLLTILDASHISPDFSRTLAPYLLREFDQVQKNQ